jgi:hypothetical protein
MTLPGAFEDLFASMSGTELRNWLGTAGSSLLQSFDNATQAINVLRDSGMHIRTGDFYAIYNQVEARAAQAAEMQTADYGDHLVPIAEHITTEWDLSTNFLYKVRMYGIDPTTGLGISKWVSVGSDRQLTQNEVEDSAAGMVQGEEAAYEIEDPDFHMDGAFVRADVQAGMS